MRVMIAAALALICVGCGEKGEASLPVTQIHVAGHTVTVEVASTREQQRRGLMGRRSLPRDHGMLFVFPEEDYRAFWMKGTPLPLSIAFIRASGDIIQIRTMRPNSTARHESAAPVKYALEMAAGWFRSHGVKAGDQVEIPGEISSGE